MTAVTKATRKKPIQMRLSNDPALWKRKGARQWVTHRRLCAANHGNDEGIMGRWQRPQLNDG